MHSYTHTWHLFTNLTCLCSVKSNPNVLLTLLLNWLRMQNSPATFLSLVPVYHLMLILISDTNLFLQASVWTPPALWMLLKWRTRKLHCPRHVCSNQSACELCPSAYPNTPTSTLSLAKRCFSTVGLLFLPLALRWLLNSVFFFTKKISW